MRHARVHCNGLDCRDEAAKPCGMTRGTNDMTERSR